MRTKFMKVLLVIAICGLALGLTPARAVHAAGPWFVRADGSDTTCNGLADAPATAAPACAFATITKAVTSASPGDSINVAAGEYLEEVNLNKAGLQLTGAGYATTTIKGPKTGGAHTLIFGANNLIVDGFTITRDGNNPGDWATNAKNQGVIFNQGTTGSTLQNCRVVGNRNGVYLNNTQGQTLRRNIITDNRTGIQLVNNVTGLVVRENEITNNWTLGILFNFSSGFLTTSVQIHNNTITGNWYGDVQNRWDAGNGVMDLSGNWFGARVITTSAVNSVEPGYATQIPVAYGGTATPPAVAVEMIGGTQSAKVDYSPWLNSGTDTDPVTPGFQGNFSFLNVNTMSPQSGAGTLHPIQDGINQASTGGTVNAWDGTYYGGFTVNKALTLRSENGAAVTTLHGGLTSPAIYVASIRASNVTVEGFTITNPNYTSPDADVAGVMVAYYGDPVITNVRIHHNVVTEIGSPSRLLTDPDNHWNATGIVSSGAVDGLEIDHNTVSNMHHTNSGSTVSISPLAIGIFGESDVKYTQNINVHDNLIYDISATNTNGATGGGYGISLGWASGPGVVANNMIHDVAGRGISTSIYTYGAVDVTGNTLYNIDETAILFRSLPGGSIVGNNIYDNVAGVTLAETMETAPSIHHNRIVANITGVINLSSTVPVVAENNWWGCNEGNPPACVTISGNVDFSPWLVLSTSVVPGGVSPLGTAVFTANLKMNSNGADTSAAGFLPDGIAASFTAPDGGAAAPTTGASLDGSFAPVNFTAPASAGEYRVCALVDNARQCNAVEIIFNVFMPLITRQ